MNTSKETVVAMAGGSTQDESGIGIKLSGLYFFKEGMSTIYTEEGESVPVTVLRYEPWVVSHIKTKERDGYAAVQVACRPKKSKNALLSEKNHFKKAGFENGASLVKEIRQDLPDGLQLGQRVLLESFAKGDLVKLTAKSKGRGFAGVVKRHHFAGGPATHGAGFHRKGGSVGNRTWPGRVRPGKRMPGHFGNESVTVKHAHIVDVIPQENVLIVKGPVPGARNGLVKLVKE